jgi:hypothetical protein
VHDHVAGTALVTPLAELVDDPAHVARDGAGLQRRALARLAELAALGVDERGPEVLRLADDARVRHAHELDAHLDRDALERAVDDRGRDGIDTARGVDGRLGHGATLLR